GAGVAREGRRAPRQVVTERVRLDVDVGSRLAAALPLTDAQPAGHEDPLSLLDRHGGVGGELTECGDRIPVGFAVHPLLLRAVEAPLRGREPEAGNGESLLGGEGTWFRANDSGERDDV